MVSLSKSSLLSIELPLKALKPRLAVINTSYDAAKSMQLGIDKC